jgi:FHA domain
VSRPKLERVISSFASRFWAYFYGRLRHIGPYWGRGRCSAKEKNDLDRTPGNLRYRLSLENGYWFIADLNSSNGTKLNGTRIAGKRRLDPGAIIAVAKHQYEIQYDPESLGASGAPPADDDAIETMMKSSLMQRAGLDRRSEDGKSTKQNLDEDI